MDMDELTNLKEKIHDTHGMEFLDYDILFKGICPACKENGKRRLRTVKLRGNGGENG